MKNKKILRLFLSTIIFLWGVFILAGLTLFPIPLIMLISLIGLIIEPFVWLLKKSGAEIESIEPFVNTFDNKSFCHFLGLTVYIWGAFAIVYIYIQDGEIFGI